MTPADVPAWLQAGGLLAFAAAVWLEQRAMRVAIEAQAKLLSAVLEYMRSTRRAPTPPPVDE